MEALWAPTRAVENLDGESEELARVRERIEGFNRISCDVELQLEQLPDEEWIRANTAVLEALNRRAKQAVEDYESVTAAERFVVPKEAEKRVTEFRRQLADL